MIEHTNLQLAAWQTFYVIVGSASGALVGLQFVVMALIADMRRQTSHATIRAFGTPTVVHFSGGLITAAVMVAPWRSLAAVAIAIGVCAFAGFAYAVLVTRHARRQKGYQPSAQDWWWYVILPCLLYGSLAVAALLLPTHVQPALFAIAAVALALLMIGIRNAWDTVTYVVTQGPAEDEPPATSE